MHMILHSFLLLNLLFSQPLYFYYLRLRTPLLRHWSVLVFLVLYFSMQVFNLKCPEIAGDWSSTGVLVHSLNGTRDTVHYHQVFNGLPALLSMTYPHPHTEYA